MNGKRRKEIDLLKGFGIFLMVFNHVGFGGVLHHYIQSFHMPLFFLVSGYLWYHSDERYAHRILRKAKALLIPYAIFGLLLTIIWTVINRNQEESYILGGWINFFFYPTNGVPLGGPLWFLPSMFIADSSYTIIRRKIPNILTSGIIVIGLATLGCLYSSIAAFPEIPFAIEPALTAILFLYMGEILRKYDRVALNLSPGQITLLFIISITMSYVNPTIDMRTSRYCFAPLYFLSGLFNSLCWWNIAKRSEGIQNIISWLLVYFSLNSIVFLILNRAFILLFELIVANIFPPELFWEIGGKIIVLVFTLGFCIVASEVLKGPKFKWLIGK